MARLVAFLAILLMVSAAHSAPTCSVVNKKLAPCLLFVKGSSKDPSPACCTGAKELNNDVHTSKDKQAVCMCLKKSLSTIGDYEPSKLSLIPKKCGLKLVLPPIDQKTDCAKFALGY